MAGLGVRWSWLPGEDPVAVRMGHSPAHLLRRAANRLAHPQIKPNDEARYKRQAAAHDGR